MGVSPGKCSISSFRELALEDKLAPHCESLGKDAFWNPYQFYSLILRFHNRRIVSIFEIFRVWIIDRPVSVIVGSAKNSSPMRQILHIAVFVHLNARYA